MIEMRMADPIPQFSHLVREMARRHPTLAYIHVVEPRVADGGSERVAPVGEVCSKASQGILR